MNKLPRHLRGADKHWPIQIDSPYFNGRLVQDRNHSYEDEANLGTLKATLEYAQKLLNVIPPSANKSVPPKYAEDVLDLYYALDNITRLFPKINCWVIYNTRGDWHVAPLFGFFNLDQALDVASRWQAYHDSRWKDAEQWYVSRGSADIRMVIHPEFKKLELLEPGR